MRRPSYTTLPTIGREQLTADFRSLGLRSGETVFVHSSLSRIACHSSSLPSNFSAIEPALVARGLLISGKVGCAECRMARAADILDTALAELDRDPLFLRQPPASDGAERRD